MISVSDVPSGSVLGINYSGMHDSTVAIVAPDGTSVFACALERISRVKQDGRPPVAILDAVPWQRIAKAAISTEAVFIRPAAEKGNSSLLSVRLKEERPDGLRHGPAFYDFLDEIPVPKEFVCHQMAHAASAFWGSGFDDALCLTYDGGMCNSPWFGGLYAASRKNGIRALDQFNALQYAKVTSLYTFVTALLGFTPNKHEGKITGLAAYGKPTTECRELLRRWFEDEFLDIETAMEWIAVYDRVHPPMFWTRDGRIQRFREAARDHSRETLSATVQDFAEQHVLEILKRAKALGWESKNVCLAGGLFSNVKINQCVAQNFSRLFVAPPMTDDGTALGAALHVLSKETAFDPPLMRSMYLGPAYDGASTRALLEQRGIKFSAPEQPARKVAELLASGRVVAVFQGAMEFGPRALGNRSILAEATRQDINQSLNARLNRTEFMPFAPMSRVEDASRYYLDIERVAHAAEFMTVTVDCQDEMKSLCPAVVHVDGTARPQLVRKEVNPFIHGVLTHYADLTGRCAIVNTSFNIHEEPIICSTDDALQGFFEAGIDYLFLEGGFVVSFAENTEIAVRYVQEKLRQPNQKIRTLSFVCQMQSEQIARQEEQLREKERYIQRQIGLLKERDDLLKEVKAYRLAYGKMPFLRLTARMSRRLAEMLGPRLGNLNQYGPRPLRTSEAEVRTTLEHPPMISIVVPSYHQGGFIERTLLSIFKQNYPAVECFVQDGGSRDATVEVLTKYEGQLLGWVSEKDSGQAQAINRGFARVTGEIMGWLNSDDLLLPGCLHIVADYFNRNPEVDVVYGNRLLIDENDMEIGRWILPGHDDAVLSWADYVPQETMFWRRRIWEKVGAGVDESFRFAMDWDLIVRFREAGARFAHIPRFLGAFRVHEHQKTSAAIHTMGFIEMDRIRERVLGRVPSHKEIRRAILPYICRHVVVDMAHRIRRRTASAR